MSATDAATGSGRPRRTWKPTPQYLEHKYAYCAAPADDNDTTTAYWNQTHHILHAATKVSAAEALKGPDSQGWLRAQDRDIDGKMKSGSFQHVDWKDIPPGTPLLRPVASFMHKPGAEDGKKARVTADDSDNPEKYSAPAPNIQDTRTFLTMSASTGLPMWIEDASQAFNNGRLKNPVYMRYPRGSGQTESLKSLGPLKD